MKHAIVLLYILIILNIANIATSYLSIKKDPVSMQDRQTIIRGGIVFNTYCVLCHGENADGNGRLSEGKLVAKRALEKGIKEVYFDRGRYKYHGRIKAVADSARKEGLKF